MPLHGIKVIELAGLAPVPFCGMILSNFGASVVRVDRASSEVSDIAVDFLGNGKRSIGLNLKSKEGTDILKKMSQQSDVILDPFRPGIMEKLGLGPDTLTLKNKRLIYARLSGFGQTGPYAKMAGHDINYVGLSGLLSLFGRHHEKPTPPVNLTADFGGGGLTCAFGIVLALLERTRSNEGQVIDVSMVEGSAYLGSWLYRSQGLDGLWGQPRGKNLLDGGAHFYDTYETKDGQFMAVGALEPQFYAVLLEKLGLSEDDLPQFGDFEKSRSRLAQIFKEKTQKEWCTVFEGTDACVTPVLSLESATLNPQNVARCSFQKSESGDIIPNPAPRLSRTPGCDRTADKPNPAAGQNSIDILLEYGFTTDQIQKYLQQRVIYQKDVSTKL
ncbi:alpha-methylacyl-CoA racemase [Diprion similis]|uniref:alpha-methylacyl-CoA racemase n=1 Tax=Diprion similis TaxID=362088 RepID=UPI001EF96432|nr:alpha-methylacyl-CoA racemase [Diprion similis]